MRFIDIPGQEIIKDRLRKTVSEQRVSHAQMFLGPQGSGKLPMALAYAQYINCSRRTAEDACGVCPSCIQYSKLAHPDLHFLYPVATTKEFDSKPMSTMFLAHWRQLIPERAGFVTLKDWYDKIGIENKQGLINTDDCNDLIRKLSYTSYESEYKIMIIWMVEKIHHSGANKILKILEEPPDKTLFLLITEQLDLILPTIISRTQLVKFPKYDDAALEQGVMALSGCTPEEAADARFMADGNMTMALSSIRNGDSYAGLFIQFRDWMRLCFTKNISALVKMSSEFSGQGRENMKRFFHYALRIVHLCMLHQHGLRGHINAAGEELEFISKFSPYINPSNIQFTEAFNEAIYHIERNASGSIMFLDLSLKSIKWLKK
jgi:DNA polymerase-3 subunit delta'